MDADLTQANKNARRESIRGEKPFPWAEILSAVWFHRGPEVLEGSTIVVRKKPPPERNEFDLGGTIKDCFAVVASTATVIYPNSQVKKQRKKAWGKRG